MQADNNSQAAGSAHKTLKLSFHGQILDHLGIQMYQSPVAAVAELISNSWDADAESVKVMLPTAVGMGSVISITDNGVGMTFDECEKKYLKIGQNRRETPDAHSPEKKRPILGRKGIGKFAGFGIAEAIKIETISKETGEKTVFVMELQQLRKGDYVEQGGEIPVLEYLPPDEARKAQHGTIVTLSALTLNRRPSTLIFGRSMARRFLLNQKVADFKVLINGDPLPPGQESGDIELLFPRDYAEEQKPPTMLDTDGDWGIEQLSDGSQIRWNIAFYKKPIDEEELRGVAVFARYKLAQRPFFFNLTGGLGGQHGLSYLTGQVEADYIDQLQKDLIATERQRINWDTNEAGPLLVWGQERIKSLLKIWKAKRAEAKIKILNAKLSPFESRLKRFLPHERKIIEKALRNLAGIAAIEDDDFVSLADSLLLAWEGGRLQELIVDIADADEMEEKDLLGILLEANVLTSLHTAEAVKAKLDLIAGLHERITKRELENAVRDYIAKSPWLVDPVWETFLVEKSVENVIKTAASSANLDTDEDWEKRIDLVLSSGDHLLILEFMRPDLKIDYDHLHRFELYVRSVRTQLRANTAGRFKRVTGYIIADKLSKDPVVIDKLESLARENMHAMDWATLLSQSVAKWKDFLEVLISRAPDDDRLTSLAKELGYTKHNELETTEETV
jgi:hypothetical protein